MGSWLCCILIFTDFLKLLFVKYYNFISKNLEKTKNFVDTQVLGFDCEWVTEKGKSLPVGLLQLCAPDGTCVLVQLLHMQQPFSTSFLSLLSDRRYL